MAVFCAEIWSRGAAPDPSTTRLLREAGLDGLTEARAATLFFLEGDLDRGTAERIGEVLLADPVAHQATVRGADDPPASAAVGTVAVEVHPRPGVMDPVAQSTLTELRAAGYAVVNVRTGRRFVLGGAVTGEDARRAVGRALANDCIEEVVVGTAGVQPSPQPPVRDFELRQVEIRELDESALAALSRTAHLFLSLEEMKAIQAHYRAQEREPTDLELETLAQTWSEHCVHKTLKSAMQYHGAPLPDADGRVATDGEETRQYDNLLRETIARVTDELVAAGRGPQCLSVFKDNAGVIAFDDELGLAFKVETHNHPSAIEPYGGAATGIGGVIRDVIGCGLGAKPIANTDVFCVGPSDWPRAHLPKGVLHPERVLRGIVRGVADYGNRMGIPTVNGAVYVDPRYLGNPLVYCGCLGTIPRDLVEKAAQPGDVVVVIGGRTGRDGIHGATFSSAELTDTHADEFSHAVQIGNAITEKRVLDAVLLARDAEGGCLYSAITDCGAGGLSSAVGEMGETVGAVIDLETVPLKYAGLRYDEIWISEAQERMVVAVPPARLDRFMAIAAAEEVEATVIGRFGHTFDDGRARLELRYQGTTVGDLDLHFLHNGVPQRRRVAEWWPAESAQERTEEPCLTPAAALDQLGAELQRPNVASKVWIIRQYDHEVQGGSVIKPLLGPGRGPGDAAVLRPRMDSVKGVAIGCGLVPHLADRDPYWMAAASIDEALRNVVAVGGDPDQTAILDNFCWGSTDDPRQLGALVRACQACYDVAKANGVPFISGKDSLNNEFALDAGDVAPLLDALRARAAGGDADARHLAAILPELSQRISERQRLAIPATLLISAISLITDVTRCVTPDLKAPGNVVVLVGGVPQVGFSAAKAARIHRAVAELIAGGRVRACHDVSDGGWLTALAEMALSGQRGAEIIGAPSSLLPFAECCAAYLVETTDADGLEVVLEHDGIEQVPLARVSASPQLVWQGARVDVAALQVNWQRSTS